MALMTPVILIGGMASGAFTPTEAAVAATRLCAVPRPLRLPHADAQGFVRVCMETVETTVDLLFIVGGASIFG